MCGRFVSAGSVEDLLAFFVADERRTPRLPARWNVAPSQPIYAVVDHDRRRYLVTFDWGLLPPRACALPLRPLINARAETVATRPAFREALARRRCLVPADAFYEWRRGGGGSLPFAVRRRDGAPLAFAGLWSAATGPDGSARRTCAIVTTRANATVAAFHDRMPVVVEPDSWDAWLDPRADRDALAGLLRPAEPDVLRLHPVGPEVGDVRADHPGLLDPVAAPATLWPEEDDPVGS